jgi:hypothetical protein
MVVNSWYNGYSPKERDDKYKEMKRLIKMGQLLPASGPCDLCNDPNVPVEYHDEDYGHPYLWTKPTIYKLCRHCHRYKLHKRFKSPTNWSIFLAHIRRGGYASEIKDKEIDRELKLYKKALYAGLAFQLKILRAYKNVSGEEWFSNLRMDIESLEDPKARPRG